LLRSTYYCIDIPETLETYNTLVYQYVSTKGILKISIFLSKYF